MLLKKPCSRSYLDRNSVQIVCCKKVPSLTYWSTFKNMFQIFRRRLPLRKPKRRTWLGCTRFGFQEFWIEIKTIEDNVFFKTSLLSCGSLLTLTMSSRLFINFKLMSTDRSSSCAISAISVWFISLLGVSNWESLGQRASTQTKVAEVTCYFCWSSPAISLEKFI